MEKVCRICGADLPAQKPTGRPPIYCSTSCRRAAELEITRVNRRLGDLEGRLSLTRSSSISTLDDPAMLEREIARQRDRLLELIEGDA